MLSYVWLNCWLFSMFVKRLPLPFWQETALKVLAATAPLDLRSCLGVIGAVVGANGVIGMDDNCVFL